MKSTLRPAVARGRWSTIRLLCAPLLLTLAVGAGDGQDAGQPRTVLKTERFDKDPGWEGHNNRIVPERLPTVVQDFGHSQTNFAGKEKGEIGGQGTRAAGPAYYAGKKGPGALDDKLSASGAPAPPKTTAAGGGL